jgi:hypothetical protein
MTPALIAIDVIAVLAWIAVAFCFQNLKARAKRGLTVHDPATKWVYRLFAVHVTCGLLASLVSAVIGHWL